MLSKRYLVLYKNKRKKNEMDKKSYEKLRETIINIELNVLNKLQEIINFEKDILRSNKIITLYLEKFPGIVQHKIFFKKYKKILSLYEFIELSKNDSNRKILDRIQIYIENIEKKIY